jgi:glucokinase
VIALLDIGGTKVAAAVAEDGVIRRSARMPTPTSDPASAVQTSIDDLRDGAPLRGIALAVPGPFSRSEGALLNPPGMPAAWHGLGLGAILEAHYHCEVVVENDANCGALAEATAGAARDDRTAVYFTVSTGVGTGVVRDRRLVIGRHDTEGGHQVLWPEWLGGPACDCGGAGCLEALASGRAIERRFGRRPEDLQDQQAWDDVGRWLGLAVTNATALLDPDVVVFGGGVCASWERFSNVLQSTVLTHTKLQPPPRVLLGVLPEEERNLIGALALLSPLDAS